VSNEEFLRLIDALDTLITQSPRMPLTQLALVNEQELVGLLAQLRASIPDEATRAAQRRAERAGILARAQADAEETLARAQDEVERIVHDPHLQRDARQRAQEVLSAAELKAQQIRSAADAYFVAELETFERHLSDLETVLARDLLAMRQGVESLRERTTPPTAGAMPLEPERPLMAPDNVKHEYHTPPDAAAPMPEPRSGPNTPDPDSPLA
jgi:hypothetical protein